MMIVKTKMNDAYFNSAPSGVTQSVKDAVLSLCVDFYNHRCDLTARMKLYSCHADMTALRSSALLRLRILAALLLRSFTSQRRRQPVISNRLQRKCAEARLAVERHHRYARHYLFTASAIVYRSFCFTTISLGVGRQG